MDMFATAAESLHAATGIDPEYQRSGMLLLPPYQEQLATQWCAQHQVALQQVDLAEYLHGQHGAGLLLPDVAQVRNPRLMQALRRHVEMLGGEILEQHEVLGFEVCRRPRGCIANHAGKIRRGCLHRCGGRVEQDIAG